MKMQNEHVLLYKPQYLYDKHTVEASCVELSRDLGRAFNIFDKKYQRTFSSQQMPFLYPSSNKHF